MKIIELYEGAEPRLPGAVSGIKVMTPQQFVGIDDNEEVDEDWKKSLGTAALTGAMALGSAGVSARVMPGDDPNINRFTGKPIATQQSNNTAEPKAQYDIDTRILTYKGKQYKWDPQSQATGQGEVVSAPSMAVGSRSMGPTKLELNPNGTYTKAGVNESEEHLNKIRKLSGLDEATALPASSRELGGDEFQDYTGKTKTDKYKMPYIHRSSAIEFYDEGGKRFKEEAVIQALQQRPKKLLKQNEKMKHSNGEFEQFFNVGFAALTGVAVDESTNKLIIVNTCPGAGSCKVDCFAMKGGKVQFKAAWLSDGRILTYLLNDPSGFFNQLSSEIASEEAAATKGDKKFPNGWQVTVRWHDAGDFFSPEYLELALNMAAKHPNVKFYANLDNTKNSRIVPEKLFYDLLAKDEKGNLKKTADGAWQPANPEALVQMKQRIAKEYGISASSILSYTEYMGKRNSIPAGMKYNVIVAPGEGDVSANDQGVLSTLLLRH